jgi:hypothetical protein
MACGGPNHRHKPIQYMTLRRKSGNSVRLLLTKVVAHDTIVPVFDFKSFGGTMFKFSRGNAKLDALEKTVGGPVYTFSELSGHTCPFARDCYSKAVKENGKTKIVDGPDTIFRCFSASQEIMYSRTYDQRKYNTDLVTGLQSATKYTDMILESMPDDAKCMRIHVGGDFRLRRHFQAWRNAALELPAVLFYAYTKALPFWVSELNNIPANMVLTASRGGKADKLIDEYNLREAVVIADKETCEHILKSGNINRVSRGQYKGYPIDHDDSFAAMPEHRNTNFALLIHAGQPAGSDAGKAVSVLNGVGSYRKGKS